MSTATRVPLDHATEVAAQLVEALGPGCERIGVAGSIRRGRPDVGDIELVAIPRVHEEQVAEGLFDTRTLTVDELQVCIDLALMDGTLTAHPDDPKRGPRYSKLVHAASGIQLDLFSVRAETWGVALLIRTGPADFSHWFVSAIKGRGWHVGKGFELHRGALACAARVSPCEAVPTPDETDAFRLTDMTWIEPADRR